LGHGNKDCKGEELRCGSTVYLWCSEEVVRGTCNVVEVVCRSILEQSTYIHNGCGQTAIR
jgi:hypothetical protein